MMHFYKMRPYRFVFYLIAGFFGCTIQGCHTIDLYEKEISFSKNQWPARLKPSFTFTIKDTTVPYQVYVILRHNEKYNFNNIWINLYTKGPLDSVQKVQYELPLATGEKGWLGTAMDDLYEHRINLTPSSQKFFFKKSGEYTFSLEQIMREDPLENVMNVGLRIEKKSF